LWFGKGNAFTELDRIARKVDARLPGNGNSNSHGARPVHLIISMIKWIRTSRLSGKNSLSLAELSLWQDMWFGTGGNAFTEVDRIKSSKDNFYEGVSRQPPSHPPPTLPPSLLPALPPLLPAPSHLKTETETTQSLPPAAA